MQYRRLGKSDLDVSVIGFGASPLGNVFANVSSSAASQAVAAAIENGINLFDVSPYYGTTLAEERLGEALAHKRPQILLATKCGRYGRETFDFSANGIVREFEQSLRRLRTEYVDLLQAHDIEFGDVEQIIGETIPAMHRLQEQGKVRLIGLTSYWPGLLARVASQTNVDTLLNYCHANLFVNDIDEQLLPFAETSGIGLLNASPLHMGLLAGKPVPAWHPAPQVVRKAAQQVKIACERFDVDPGTLGLSFCLNHRAVASTLIGISSEAEVTAACLALNWTPPADLVATIRCIVEPAHNVVWPSGLEKNQDTSANPTGKTDVAH
jgi:L-galactose dehydrogenase